MTPGTAATGRESVGSPISIVGAGHFMLTCDRIGPGVLERIRGRFGREVELCEVGTSGLALLDVLHGQELLIVVDACAGGEEPGRIREVDPDLEAPGDPGTSVHQVGPVETLAVARLLYPERMPARTRLVLVETDGLDDEGVDSACDRVVGVLDREVRTWRDRGGGASPRAGETP
jgi:hydrogenase maturation protease